MSLKKFIDDLSRGLESPAYLLHAEDAFLLKEAELTVKRTVPESERDFLFHVFDLDAPEGAPPIEQIVDVLNTVPLIGGRKHVVVENVQRLSEKGVAPLSAYLSSPSPDSVLVLLYNGAIKKAHKAGLSSAKNIPLDIRDKDIPAWTGHKAREKGFDITDRAVEYLIGAVGPDLGLIYSEIEKLAASGKKTIDEADAAEVVRGPGGYNAFDLARALDEKDARRAFTIYRALSETQEPIALLGAINWHYGRKAWSQKERCRVFALLNEADTLVRSTGGAYPLEHLFFRLLRP